VLCLYKDFGERQDSPQVIKIYFHICDLQASSSDYTDLRKPKLFVFSKSYKPGYGTNLWV